jgi:rhodanese-related sulfurtransferase/DNA-binding transcriptional ArsR family regulator
LATIERTTKTRAELYDAFAVVGKALSAGRRLEILDYLSQGPRSVSCLADELNQSVANTSQHLQVLLQAGLVTCRRDDHRMIYDLRRADVAQLLSTICDLAVEEMPEASSLAVAHLGDRNDIPWISARELARLIRSGKIVVIDVRPEIDFRADHIVGAISVPNDRIADFAQSLAPSVEVIAYCRGEYCSLADRAVRALRDLGVRARRLEGGFPHWVARGGAHEKTA